MSERRRSHGFLVAALTVLAALLLASVGLASANGPPAAGSRRIVVIVSARSTLRDVSRALLRRVFLGEATTHDGRRLIPLNYGPGDPLRLAFDQLALGMTAADSGRYWVDRRIRGQGFPPRAVSNRALLRAAVAHLPGAIGYLTPELLDATVRALTVDGIAYDKPNYPL